MTQQTEQIKELEAMLDDGITHREWGGLKKEYLSKYYPPKDMFREMYNKALSEIGYTSSEIQKSTYRNLIKVGIFTYALDEAIKEIKAFTPTDSEIVLHNQFIDTLEKVREKY